jgi:hypothetical protein
MRYIGTVYEKVAGKYIPLEPDDVDYRALWMGLKGELKHEALGYSNSLNKSTLTEIEKTANRARRMLDRMERAETLAKVKEIRIP